jgi:HK97 family phage major capsid protein
MDDIIELINQQAEGFKDFKANHLKRVETLEQELKELSLKAGRAPLLGLQGAGGSSADPQERKHLEAAFRALLEGDMPKANRAFVEAKAMDTGTDPSGGYVVHPLISDTMTKVMLAISPIYRLARKVPMNMNDAFEEPIDRDKPQTGWVGERSARTETTTPELKLLRIPLEEIYCMPKVTQRLIDTASINIVDWMTSKVGEAFAADESAAFHTGDSINKPRGFLNYPQTTTKDATRAWGTVQTVNTGTSGAFPASSPGDVLIDLASALRAQYRRGAVWLMNQATAGVVQKFKDGQGNYLWANSVQVGQPSSLLGYPVEIDEDMPDIGAGTTPIAFGNIERAYTIIEMPGIRFLADPFSAKPHVLLYNYRRVGGGLSNSEAVKLLKMS